MSFDAYWIRVTEIDDGDAMVEWLSATDDGVASTIVVPSEERERVAEMLLRGINLGERK